VNAAAKISPGFSRYFFLCLAYYAGAFCLLALLLKCFDLSGILNSQSILKWDAGHYDYIAHKEYTGFRNTFFPLFPFVWKFLSMGTVGITFFNGFLYIISMSTLASMQQYSAKEFLLMLTFPSLVFLFLPYAESFFFLFSSLALLGIYKKNGLLLFVGLFFATLTRPVGCLFIPILIAMVFFDLKNWKINTFKTVGYLSAVLLGMAAVVVIQYLCTGDWLAFSHAEKQWWGNAAKFPSIPLTSWAGDDIVRLDGTALLTGIVASIVLIVTFLKRLKSKEYVEDTVLLFSMLYLAAVCWFVLFTRGGSMFSLNRFVYCTPFFFVSFSALIKRKWSLKEYGIIFLCVNAFWLLMGSYVHIQQVLKYLGLTIFLMSFITISHPKKYISTAAYVVCLLGNVTLQLYFYYRFLNGGWIG
jgi:hypothetical protein